MQLVLTHCVEEGSSGRFESEDVGHLLGLELAQLRGGSYGYQQAVLSQRHITISLHIS
jgi:hypothetical protein